MTDSSLNGKIGIKPVILDGFSIFLKNPQITILIFVGMVLIYLFLLGAITLIIPPEKLVDMAGKEPEEFVEEIITLLSESIEKTLIAIFVFGTIAFVVTEFIAAGIISLAIDANSGKNTGLSSFIRYGYIYTPRMVMLEILTSVALIAVIFPFTLLLYVTRSSAMELIQSIAIFVMSILLFPARFILIYEDSGVFESLAEGIRFGFQNFLWTASILILSSILIVPSLFFPPTVIIAVPVLISLSTIWFSRFYFLVRSSSEHFLEN